MEEFLGRVPSITVHFGRMPPNDVPRPRRQARSAAVSFVVPDRVIFETAGVAGQALGYSESGHRAAAIRRRRMNDTETTRLATIDQQKLAALKALKKSLLHQAFSGEL